MPYCFSFSLKFKSYCSYKIVLIKVCKCLPVLVFYMHKYVLHIEYISVQLVYLLHKI